MNNINFVLPVQPQDQQDFQRELLSFLTGQDDNAFRKAMIINQRITGVVFTIGEGGDITHLRESWKAGLIHN